MGSASEGESGMKSAPTCGNALLLVMWAMFVMSVSILGLIHLLKITIGTASTMERVAIASSLAYAGTTIGRNAHFPADGKIDKRTFANGGQLEVTALSENGKLNIVNELASGERNTLRALFRLWGLNDVEADTVVDCLLDYVEPGAIRRLNGAKAEQYRMAGRDAPSGKMFRSVSEMANVLNFDLVSNRKANWMDFFTVYGDGTLDLTSAPADLIKVVCRIGDSSVSAIVRGQAEGGVPIRDLEAARMAMGLTDKEFSELRSRISVGGNVRRVLSKGSFAQNTRFIETISIVGNNPAILNWREW